MKLNNYILLAFAICLSVNAAALSNENKGVDADALQTLRQSVPLQLLEEAPESVDPETMDPAPLGHCVAWSYITGFYYQWYSYNIAYARYRALSACVAVSGYTCTYSCRWVY